MSTYFLQRHSRTLFNAAALLELLVGMALLLSGDLLIWLLTGSGLAAPNRFIARLLGIALVSLAVCAYQPEAGPNRPGQWGLFVYNISAALLFSFLALVGGPGGALIVLSAASHWVLAAVILWLIVGRG